jgi:signal transduction histidine kinase
MNSAAEELLGVWFSKVFERPIDFAIKENTLRDKIKETLSKKTTGYQFDFELPGTDPEHPRTMRARTSVIHGSEGKNAGIVTIINDVTHEREVDKMKTEFLSTAAHELRTPLTSIQGFSEVLLTRDNLAPEEQRKFLTYINTQAINLGKIISDLLDISRIESGGRFILERTPWDPVAGISQTVSYFQDSSKKHRFEVALPDEQVELNADKGKMEQVLKNLLSNAVKYSPEGGLVRVSGELLKNEYRITVADEGMGMTPEQVEKIFDKFYRVDASDTAIEGTGLGMTIVKYIVEAHGGRIWVESEHGKGTTVRFTIKV